LEIISKLVLCDTEFIIVLTDLGMKNKEQDLQNQKSNTTAGRSTRGIDNSSKYAELLSKKSREERLHSQNTEAVFEVYLDVVFN